LRSERVFVHFEAITYLGRVSVNGRELGTMRPYIPYESEFTRQAKEGENTAEVASPILFPAPTAAGKMNSRWA